jgi:hypothetical protein
VTGIDRNEEPHRHREWAESFGTDPERYHRTRPRYPAEIIRDLVDVRGLPEHG